MRGSEGHYKVLRGYYLESCEILTRFDTSPGNTWMTWHAVQKNSSDCRFCISSTLGTWKPNFYTSIHLSCVCVTKLFCQTTFEGMGWSGLTDYSTWFWTVDDRSSLDCIHFTICVRLVNCYLLSVRLQLHFSLPTFVCSGILAEPERQKALEHQGGPTLHFLTSNSRTTHKNSFLRRQTLENFSKFANLVKSLKRKTLLAITPSCATTLVCTRVLSGRHCGIASPVFSHRGSTSQRTSAARTRVARIFASHRIAISCLARIVGHIASLPASRDMFHSQSFALVGQPRESVIDFVFLLLHGELLALQTANQMRAAVSRPSSCYLGTFKPSIWHLDDVM